MFRNCGWECTHAGVIINTSYDVLQKETIPVTLVNWNPGDNCMNVFRSGSMEACHHGPLAVLSFLEPSKRSDVLLVIISVDIPCVVNILCLIEMHVQG